MLISKLHPPHTNNLNIFAFVELWKQWIKILKYYLQYGFSKLVSFEIKMFENSHIFYPTWL